jgi:hypothetical protein
MKLKLINTSTSLWKNTCHIEMSQKVLLTLFSGMQDNLINHLFCITLYKT